MGLGPRHDTTRPRLMLISMAVDGRLVGPERGKSKIAGALSDNIAFERKNTKIAEK